MPPFVGRKRGRDSSPVADPEPTPPKKKKPPRGKKLITDNKKPKVPGAIESKDARASVRANEKFLEQLESSSSDGSPSDVDSDDFEDVLPSKKQKVSHVKSEDEADWEDALPSNSAAASASAPSGDLELTLNKSNDFETLALTDGTKKGPSKIERQIRINTHRMHVQILMAHHLFRNGWACDYKAQEILVNQLPASLSKSIENWRTASGGTENVDDIPTSSKKGKGKSAKGKRPAEPRKQRDWGNHAVRQGGASDASQGDPLPRLLKELVVYWKGAFRVTAPGLRKQGYKPISTLQEEIASFKNDPHDPEKHGERLRGRSEFRQRAKLMEGSRDTGAQLFLCLLRGLGIEARLVANLQPLGFGWSKSEEAKLEKAKERKMTSDDELSFSSEDDNATAMSDTKSQATTPAKSVAQKPQTKSNKPPTAKSTTPKQTKKPQSEKGKPSRRQPGRGAKDLPISLDSDDPVSVDSSSSALSDAESVSSGASLEVIEPHPTPQRKANMRFDRSLAFPNSWVEAVSPISFRVIPIDPIVTHTVATREEDLVAFEPRGKKAEKGNQVMAYVIAYNSDGTAKEVTTRYLKRHQWPGKTKGMRIPVEKIPLYNRKGKVQRYMQYDWFKTVLRGYARSAEHRTAVDDIEEQTDLKPLQITKKVVPKSAEEIDTLAGYKASADFVLERHLRRDEALLPEAEPVRYFTPTAGSKSSQSSSKAAAQPEAVYRRKDVVTVKTAESWHKEGRGILPGSQPLKTSKIRAVTLQRQREVEEATRTHGTAPTQGLYSREQTDWIIPPPIVNGVIPKNSYGSMDVFVSSMIPEGAAHVPWRGAMKAAKKIGCDYAEAVTGFEFGNRRAVPVIQGVIVPAEHEAAMIEEIQRAEEEKRIREEGKRSKAALGMWRKFVMGLRIVERVREEYGPETHGAEERNPFLTRNAQQAASSSTNKTGAGSKAVTKSDVEAPAEGGGFIADDDEDEDEDGGGGFLIENPTADDPEDDVEDDDADVGEDEDEGEGEEDGEEDESALTEEDDEEGSVYSG